MFIKNVFSEKELDVIHSDLEQALQNQDWMLWAKVSKLTQADEEKKNFKYPTEQGSITFRNIEGPVKNLLRMKLTQMDPAIRGYDFVAYYQVWDIGSATGLHDDAPYMFNATFYLNKEWNPDFGGLYVYQENDQYRVHVPEYNSCLYNNQSSLEPHLVTPVTTSAPGKRYTIHCKGIVVR